MPDTQSFAFKFSFAIRMMVVTLRQQLVAPSWLTIVTMDNKLADGENSWMDRNDGCEVHGGQASLLSHEDHGQ